MKDISLIVPAYNEASRIGPTLHSFHSFLQGLGHSFEIIVADDGSSDDTKALVISLQSKLSHLTLLSLPHGGKGHAIRRGMLAASGGIRIFCDADGSTPATDLPGLMAPLLSKAADISIGSRYLAGSQVLKAQPRFRVVWSRGVNRLIQRLLLPGICDPHCGFKAFTAEAAGGLFADARVDGWSFDLEVLSLARRWGLRIAEMPVQWANDEDSRARLRHVFRELLYVWQISRRMRAPAGPGYNSVDIQPERNAGSE